MHLQPSLTPPPIRPSRNALVHPFLETCAEAGVGLAPSVPLPSPSWRPHPGPQAPPLLRYPDVGLVVGVGDRLDDKVALTGANGRAVHTCGGVRPFLLDFHLRTR